MNSYWASRYPPNPPRVTIAEAAEAIISMLEDCSALQLRDAQRRIGVVRGQLDSAPPHVGRKAYTMARAILMQAIRDTGHTSRNTFRLDPRGGFKSIWVPPNEATEKTQWFEPDDEIPDVWLSVARDEIRRHGPAGAYALAPIFQALGEAANSSTQIAAFLRAYSIPPLVGKGWGARQVRTVLAKLHTAGALCSASTDPAQGNDLPARDAARHTNHNAPQ